MRNILVSVSKENLRQFQDAILLNNSNLYYEEAIGIKRGLINDEPLMEVLSKLVKCAGGFFYYYDHSLIMTGQDSFRAILCDMEIYSLFPSRGKEMISDKEAQDYCIVDISRSQPVFDGFQNLKYGKLQRSSITITISNLLGEKFQFVAEEKLISQEWDELAAAIKRSHESGIEEANDVMKLEEEEERLKHQIIEEMGEYAQQLLADGNYELLNELIYKEMEKRSI
jgi:hypothetical protein